MTKEVGQVFKLNGVAMPSGVSAKDLNLTDDQIRNLMEQRWAEDFLERLQLFDDVKRDVNICSKFAFESVEYLNNSKRFAIGEASRQQLEAFIYKVLDGYVKDARQSFWADDDVQARYSMDRFMEGMRPLILNLKPKAKDGQKP
jgi:hypothetical protein